MSSTTTPPAAPDPAVEQAEAFLRQLAAVEPGTRKRAFLALLRQLSADPGDAR